MSILPLLRAQVQLHLLVVPEQHPDSGTSLQELPPVEEPAENSLDNRPQGDPEAPWPRPGQGSRSCSPTSGAATRSWTFSQQQTSAGRQAQRWQQTKTARPGVGRAGTGGAGGGAGGGGGMAWGGGLGASHSFHYL